MNVTGLQSYLQDCSRLLLKSYTSLKFVSITPVTSICSQELCPLAHRGNPSFFPCTLEVLAGIPCIILFVTLVTGYWLDDQRIGGCVPIWSRILASPYHPDQLWGPPNFLFIGYAGCFPRGKVAKGMKLTAHLHLVLRSRKCGSVYPLPLCLHHIVLN
jgi:hypothetical protein